MNKIQVFQNQEFGAIRTISNEQGEPMFCAKDVCDALGYKKVSNAIALHVDKGDALKQGSPASVGREATSSPDRKKPMRKSWHVASS